MLSGLVVELKSTRIVDDLVLPSKHNETITTAYASPLYHYYYLTPILSSFWWIGVHKCLLRGPIFGKISRWSNRSKNFLLTFSFCFTFLSEHQNIYHRQWKIFCGVLGQQTHLGREELFVQFSFFIFISIYNLHLFRSNQGKTLPKMDWVTRIGTNTTHLSFIVISSTRESKTTQQYISTLWSRPKEIKLQRIQKPPYIAPCVRRPSILLLLLLCISFVLKFPLISSTCLEINSYLPRRLIRKERNLLFDPLIEDVSYSRGYLLPDPYFYQKNLSLSINLSLYFAWSIFLWYSFQRIQFI